MLVTSGIDTSAFQALAPTDDLSIRAANRQIIRMLQRHGYVCFASDDDRAKFLEALAALPQAVRKLWTTALPELLHGTAAPPIPALANVTNAGVLNAHWSDRIQVAFVGNDRGLSLGVPLGEATTVEPTSGIEVTLFAAATESSRFQSADTVANSDVPRNAKRDDIWATRFSALAQLTKTVTLLDRYAVIRLLKGKPGLEWLFARLDSCGPVNVHLLAQLENQGQIGRACKALVDIQSRLPDGGLQSLTVTFAPSAAFSAEAHCRHVRMGPVAVQLDRGVALFDDAVCGQSTPCSICDRIAALEREHRIEKRAWSGARRKRLW